MNIIPEKFLKTLKALLINPRKVYDHPDEYLNHWKFSLSLGTTSFFVVTFFHLDKFSIADIPSFIGEISISERLRDYWALRDNFESNYKFHLGLFVVIATLVPFFFLFFRQARTEFRSFIAMVIYLYGVLVLFISVEWGLTHLFSIPLNGSMVFSEILSFVYFMFYWISIFGNKRNVYFKLTLAVLLLSVVPPTRINLINLYLRIVKPERFLFSTVVVKKIINSEEVPYINVFAKEIGDTTVFMINKRNDSGFLSVLGPSSFVDVGKSSNISFFIFKKDTVVGYRTITGESNVQGVSRMILPVSQNTDTAIIDKIFVMNVEGLRNGNVVFIGRDSSWYPVIVIYDRSLKKKELVVFHEVNLMHRTFDQFLQVSDSTAIITSYKLLDNAVNSSIVTEYAIHLVNLKTGMALKSRLVFERSGVYALTAIPEMEILPDSSIVFCYVIANKMNSEFWIKRFNTSDFDFEWKKNVAVVNDMIDATVRIKYFKRNLYFVGNARLVIHKDWFKQENNYGFLGSVDLNGKHENVKYLNESTSYRTTLNGFYRIGDDLYFTGYRQDLLLRLYTILFPAKGSFRSKVRDNLSIE